MTTAASGITAALKAVTKDWAKQRRAEERNARARTMRYDRLVRQRPITIIEAAYEVMQEAYALASDNRRLPARPRQVMYAARPKILARTGRETLDDAYFTQTLLPNYVRDRPSICAGWDICWDARGDFVEPHTKHSVPLGTLEVRDYLALQAVEPEHKPIGKMAIDIRFATLGPRNRYRNILFIEKQGFEPILAAARIQQRFDIAVMSTKGMSVTAARMLLDQLSPQIGKVLVLHDCDIAGFSILGTLGTSGRRYRFANRINMVDIGLRLTDAQRMKLESEPVPRASDREWAKRRQTLSRHGATSEEIDFLGDRRVELNAMTSAQLIAFLEEKLAEHGIEKVIPEAAVLEQHTRRLLAQQHLAEIVAKNKAEIEKRIERVRLPANLGVRIQMLLRDKPELRWDEALAEIVKDEFPRASRRA